MTPGAEFFPKDDLANFIATEIVHPHLERFGEKVLVLEGQIVFVAGNQRKHGPTVGAVKRAIPIQVEIH